MTLDDLKAGQRGQVLKIIAKGPFKQRLLDLGFTAGTIVDVVKYAPLLDPIEYVVKG